MKQPTSLQPRTLAAMVFVIAFATIPAAAQRSAFPGERDPKSPSPIPLQKSAPKESHFTPPPSPPGGGGKMQETVIPEEFRRIDGIDNNVASPNLGSAGQPLLRLLQNEYADGTGSPSGQDRPGARAVSNAVCAQSDSIPNRRGATDYLWQWGQFLDHDLDETPTSNPAEVFNIPVPPGDPWFDPQATGTAEIPLNRSFGEDDDGVRQQINEITAFIDASNVYGSDEERAYALRTLDGTGRLKVTISEAGDLLPYNNAGLANAPAASSDYFLAGDVRANEQVALTAMHTLFVREHNHWAERFTLANPSAPGEEIYQFARMMVGAEMQVITYREFLPVLLGRDAIPPYQGYRPEVDPSIANVFATAAYRLGHSLLSPTLLRLEADGDESEAGHLPLASAFFAPAEIENHGIDSLLRGLASQPCQELDGFLVDDVRNFLFGPPGSGGFDLAALNLQRGRDHGLPSFNGTCRGLGLRPARRFSDINPDPAVWGQLASVYQRVDQVDCWVGGLCEPAAPGSMVGPMIHRILVDQFTRLRDGDRFFYKHYLPRELMELVEAQTLASIIRRNTGIGEEIQDHVFLVSDHVGKPTPALLPSRGRNPQPSRGATLPSSPRVKRR